MTCENCGHAVRWTHHGFMRTMIGDCLGCVDCVANLGFKPSEVTLTNPDDDSDLAKTQRPPTRTVPIRDDSYTAGYDDGLRDARNDRLTDPSSGWPKERRRGYRDGYADGKSRQAGEWLRRQ